MGEGGGSKLVGIQVIHVEGKSYVGRANEPGSFFWRIVSMVSDKFDQLTLRCLRNRKIY